MSVSYLSATHPSFRRCKRTEGEKLSSEYIRYRGGDSYQSPGPLSLLLPEESPLLLAAAEAKVEVNGVGILYIVARAIAQFPGVRENSSREEESGGTLKHCCNSFGHINRKETAVETKESEDGPQCTLSHMREEGGA